MCIVCGFAMVPIWLNPLKFAVKYRKHKKWDSFSSQDCLFLIKNNNYFDFAIGISILYLLRL